MCSIHLVKLGISMIAGVRIGWIIREINGDPVPNDTQVIQDKIIMFFFKKTFVKYCTFHNVWLDSWFILNRCDSLPHLQEPGHPSPVRSAHQKLLRDCAATGLRPSGHGQKRQTWLLILYHISRSQDIRVRFGVPTKNSSETVLRLVFDQVDTDKSGKPDYLFSTISPGARTSESGSECPPKTPPRLCCDWSSIKWTRTKAANLTTLQIMSRQK